MIDKITNVASKVVGVLRTAVEVLEKLITYIREAIQFIEELLFKFGKKGDGDVVE